MQMRPNDWKLLYELRDDLDGEDRALVRRFIKYIEHLEHKVRTLKKLLREEMEDE